MIAAGLFVAISLSAYWWHSQHAPSVLNEFWEPVVRGSGPVLIAAAYVPVYAHDAQIPNNQGELIFMPDQYVGGGDLVAAASVAGMLGRMGRASEVRVGSAVSFQDMRNSPTVLIGYSSTQWKDVTEDFRFYVDDSDRGMIRDNGKSTEWYPRNVTRDFSHRRGLRGGFPSVPSADALHAGSHQRLHAVRDRGSSQPNQQSRASGRGAARCPGGMATQEYPTGPAHEGHCQRSGFTESSRRTLLVAPWLARFAGFDMPASSAQSQNQLEWTPTGPGLITDLRNMRYLAA